MNKLYNNISDLREIFKDLWINNNFIIDKSGKKLIEIINASFIADEDIIFGKKNDEYIKQELEWYLSQSLKISDIKGKIPKIWEDISSDDGLINSNYGWCIFSKQNFNQYNFVLKELISNKDSRRAIMIYTRPSMNLEFNKNNMSDFICTNNVQFLIRDNKLHCVVQMRSNDGWAGYRNDKAWHNFVLDKLLNDLNKRFILERGNIFWNVGSLHFYEQQFYLIDYFNKTGEFEITKKEYDLWKQN